MVDAVDPEVVRVSTSSTDAEFGMLGMGVRGENATAPSADTVDGVQLVAFDRKLIPSVRQDIGIAAVQRGRKTIDIVNDIGMDHKGLEERPAELTRIAAGQAP